jgi:hypothetical protein
MAVDRLPLTGEVSMGETDKNQQGKRQAFLAAYAECGSITIAAKAADINRCTHFDWMKETEYRKAFKAAQDEACELLEKEARRRAIEGTRRYKFHKGEPILDPVTRDPYFELDYSDVLLIVLMKGNMPDKYKDRSEVTNHNIADLYADPLETKVKADEPTDTPVDAAGEA